MTMIEVRRKRQFSLVIAFIGALFASILIGFSLYQQSDMGTLLLVIFISLIISLVGINKFGLSRFLFYSALFGLTLGWRGIDVGSKIKIYPSEIFIWLALFFGLIDRKKAGIVTIPKNSSLIPFLLLASISILGMIIGFSKGRNPNSVLYEGKTFLLFLPLLPLVRKLIKNPNELKRALLILVISACLISIIGIFEYVIPSLFSNVLGLSQNLEYARVNFTGDGRMSLIKLSGFLLWGTPVVSVILVPILPFSLIQTVDERGSKKLLWLSCSLAITTGIILSGYRSAWLGLAVVIIAFFILYSKKLIPFFVFLGVGLTNLPTGFLNRFTMISSFANSSDTATIRRTTEIEKLLSSFTGKNIFGTGWASPAVFNDWLYIYVVLGLIGVLIFVFLYGRNIVMLLGVKTENTENRDLKVSLLISLLSYAICMVSGAMSQVFPLMATFWLIFMIAWQGPQVLSEKESRGKI